MLSTYFSRRRSLAIGIAASGTATGGLIFPSIVQQLLYERKIGFPWTVRVLGFVMLGMQIIALALAKQRLPPRKSGPLVEWPAFKELPYTLFAVGRYFFVFQWKNRTQHMLIRSGMFMNFWGLYFAFYYVRFPTTVHFSCLDLTLTGWFFRSQHFGPHSKCFHQ